MKLEIRNNLWSDTVECVLPLPEGGVEKLLAAFEQRRLPDFVVGEVMEGAWVTGHSLSSGEYIGYAANAETGELIVSLERAWAEEWNYTNMELRADKQWTDFVRPVRTLLAALN